MKQEHSERKPAPTPKVQLKVIRDLNPDFRINPDPDVSDLSKIVVDALSCRHQSFRDMLCISTAYVVMRCLFVCLSVTFVYSIETKFNE